MGLWLMVAAAGWVTALLWMVLWLRQRRHVRIAWKVASQAVEERKRLEATTSAVMVFDGEPTVEAIEAVVWLN